MNSNVASSDRIDDERPEQPMNTNTRLRLASLFIRNTSVVVLVLLVLLQWATPAFAADPPKAPTVMDLIDEEPEDKSAPVTVTKAIPQDEFNRGTPRSSVMGIAAALKNRDYQRVINYLDMRNVPAHIASNEQELARQLKIIVDRSLWADIDAVSDDPKGHQDDGLPAYRDIIARLKTPDGAVDILMQHVPDGKGGYVWKLSNRTVSEIPRLYELYGYGEYGEHSLNLEIFAYITTRDFNEYLESVEDLNLRILDIISAAGTRLALPARSIRLEGEVATA